MQLPSLKVVVPVLIITTLIMPFIGILAALWLIGGYISYRIFPIVSHIVLWGALGLAILLFIASVFYR